MFEHSSMPIKITKQNKNNWRLSYLWHSYNFMQLQYKSLLILPKILGKRTQMANNTYNWLFFLSLTNLPWRFWSWKKTKGIMHASIKSTLLTFVKNSMISAWTCPKCWGKWRQWPNILTTCHFWYCLSTPPCRPRSEYKLRTTWRAITCDIHNHFMKLQYKLLLSLPKNLVERTQTSKNTWNCSFFSVLRPLPAYFDPKKNNWAGSYKTHSLDFYEIKYDLCL